MSFDLNTLDPKKVNFNVFTVNGAKFIGRKIVDRSKIYIPPLADNPVRKKGKNVVQVQKLVNSLSNGFDYSKSPPLIREETRIINGKIYEYELIAGAHRSEALEILGYDKWIYDIYEIVPGSWGTYEDILRKLQLVENNHAPELGNTEDDVVNVVLRLLKMGSKVVKPDESNIREFVDEVCTNMHHGTRGKVVRDVVRKLKASGFPIYQDTITFTANDIEKFLSEKTDYVAGGEFDSVRQKYGWSVLEGYEYEYVMSAARRMLETGRESYFLCHTKSPTEKNSIADRRIKMKKQFEYLENSLLEVFKFYEKEKRFPWTVESFFPQDIQAGEDEMIPN